jgi:hypothetical protein
VLLFALALHMALLTGLLLAAKTRILVTPVADPAELLILPRHDAPNLLSPPATPDRPKKVPTTPRLPPPDTLTLVKPDSSSEVPGAAIDWSQEAQIAAAGIAKRAPAPTNTNPRPSSSNSPFAAPPAHHKGEQIPTTDGRWIVYVSEDCYQISKSITSITNATNNGMGLQTYCSRHSNKPRGDLFDQFPAYRKLHSDY